MIKSRVYFWQTHGQQALLCFMRAHDSLYTNSQRRLHPGSVARSCASWLARRKHCPIGKAVTNNFPTLFETFADDQELRVFLANARAASIATLHARRRLYPGSVGTLVCPVPRLVRACNRSCTLKIDPGLARSILGVLPTASWCSSDVRSAPAHGGRLAFECTLHLVMAPQKGHPVRWVVRSTEPCRHAVVDLKGFIKKQSSLFSVSWVHASTPASPSLRSRHALRLIWRHPGTLIRGNFACEAERRRGSSFVGAASPRCVRLPVVVHIQGRSGQFSNAPLQSSQRGLPQATLRSGWESPRYHTAHDEQGQ